MIVASGRDGYGRFGPAEAVLRTALGRSRRRVNPIGFAANFAALQERLMREEFNNQLKAAMKAGDKRKVETLRMVNAALKEKDIEARGQGKSVSDDEILGLLQKLIKSRQESAEIYEQAGRTDLSTKERAEIGIIQSFLPQPLSPAEVDAAIVAAVAETGASSVKDMSKVIAALKAKYAGRMDFGAASAAVKAKLSG
jgi:uncharacterized protein